MEKTQAQAQVQVQMERSDIPSIGLKRKPNKKHGLSNLFDRTRNVNFIAITQPWLVVECDIPSIGTHVQTEQETRPVKLV